MAILLPPSGESGEDRYQPLAEINVTPVVDVMLVLLIIFMVTAPLLTVGVPLDLPKTTAAELQQPKEPIVLSLDRDGGTYIGNEVLLARPPQPAAETPPPTPEPPPVAATEPPPPEPPPPPAAIPKPEPLPPLPKPLVHKPVVKPPPWHAAPQPVPETPPPQRA